MDKRIFKKTPEELQEYLAFKRKGSVVPNKKGKGSYKRKPKYPDKMGSDVVTPPSGAFRVTLR